VYYDRTDLNRHELGLNAGEVNGVVPEVVSHDKAGQANGIAYGPMVALLIEAIKEQDVTVARLKQQLKEQQAQNQQLLERLDALEKQVEQLRLGR
jgi:tetrahydromethanopterin S-methyltransferase subunit G